MTYREDLLKSLRPLVDRTEWKALKDGSHDEEYLTRRLRTLREQKAARDFGRGLRLTDVQKHLAVKYHEDCHGLVGSRQNPENRAQWCFTFGDDPRAWIVFELYEDALGEEVWRVVKFGSSITKPVPLSVLIGDLPEGGGQAGDHSAAQPGSMQRPWVLSFVEETDDYRAWRTPSGAVLRDYKRTPWIRHRSETEPSSSNTSS